MSNKFSFREQASPQSISDWFDLLSPQVRYSRRSEHSAIQLFPPHNVSEIHSHRTQRAYLVVIGDGNEMVMKSQSSIHLLFLLVRLSRIESAECLDWLSQKESAH